MKDTGPEKQEFTPKESVMRAHVALPGRVDRAGGQTAAEYVSTASGEVTIFGQELLHRAGRIRGAFKALNMGIEGYGMEVSIPVIALIEGNHILIATLGEKFQDFARHNLREYLLNVESNHIIIHLEERSGDDINWRRIKREASHLNYYKGLINKIPLPSIFDGADSMYPFHEILDKGNMVAVLTDIPERPKGNRNETVDGRLANAIHPGEIVEHYIHNSEIAPEVFFEKINNLDSLIRCDVPFDEYFRSAFSEYMGAQADILARLQEVYDYEQHTGARHSGRWPRTPSAPAAQPR